jgi:hypothetical protein
LPFLSPLSFPLPFLSFNFFPLHFSSAFLHRNHTLLRAMGSHWYAYNPGSSSPFQILHNVLPLHLISTLNMEAVYASEMLICLYWTARVTLQKAVVSIFTSSQFKDQLWWLRFFMGFPQSLQANSGIVPQIKWQQIPSMYFPIHYSQILLFVEQLIMSCDKVKWVSRTPPCIAEGCVKLYFQSCFILFVTVLRHRGNFIPATLMRIMTSWLFLL